MNEKKIVFAAVAIAVVLAAIPASLAVRFWAACEPPLAFVANVPGMDDPYRLKGKAAAKPAATRIGRLFEKFGGTPANLPGSWTRFRGSDFDNINKEDVKLADSWDEKGPPVLWSLELGEGFGSPAVFKGRVFILDYDERLKADMLRCFSLADGKELWRRGYNLQAKKNHGVSRTVPAVTEKYVVTIGPKCHVMCVDTDTGSYRWGIDLQAQYGTAEPTWFTGQCPLIDGSIAVLAPAGTNLVGGTNVLMMGVDCESGSVVWRTPNPKNWRMSHASVMPMTLGGKRMYVYAAIGGIAGVSAEPSDRGAILWMSDAWNVGTVAPSPVIFEDGRIFLTAGYGAGSMMLKVAEKDGSFFTESILKYKPREGFASEQHTPLVYSNYLFGTVTKDSGILARQFVCVHRDNCTNTVWSSGKTERFGPDGLGPYLMADGKFFVLDDDGILTLLKASTKEFVKLARAKVLNGRESWAPMALAGGRLMIRDSKRMLCLDVAAK